MNLRSLSALADAKESDMEILKKIANHSSKNSYKLPGRVPVHRSKSSWGSKHGVGFYFIPFGTQTAVYNNSGDFIESSPSSKVQMAGSQMFGQFGGSGEPSLA